MLHTYKDRNIQRERKNRKRYADRRTKKHKERCTEMERERERKNTETDRLRENDRNGRTHIYRNTGGQTGKQEVTRQKLHIYIYVRDLNYEGSRETIFHPAKV